MIGRAIDLLGDEWTLLLLQQVHLGVRRYGDFRDALGISDAVLAARLRRLTDAGLLRRRVYQEAPLRAEYVPTPSGAATWPILLGVWAWERRWVPGRAAELPDMRHGTCGARFTPALACGACDDPLADGDLAARWGPAGGWARSIPRATTRRRADGGRAGAQPGHFPATMAILGNRWSSAILAAALLGTTRFSDFEAHLGIPAALLSQRLDSLRGLGVLATSPSADRSGWHVYELTPTGRAFLPVVLLSTAWAHEWLSAPGEGDAIVLTHRARRHRFAPVWACDGCGRALDPTTIEVVPPGS